MSNADIVSTVSGGKVWTPPSDADAQLTVPNQNKITFDGMLFGLFCSFVVSTGIVMMIDSIIGALDFHIVNVSHFLPEKQPLISSNSGYPLSIPPTSFNAIPNVITAIITGILLFIILCIFDVWEKTSIALGLVALITLILGTSISVQINDIQTEKPMTPTTWMSERYGFEPLAETNTESLSSGMLMRDSNSKDVIAEVKETNGEYLLYDLNGRELPLKN